MSELSKEHFDQVVSGLITRADAKATEQRIIKRIDEAQEELARMVAGGFEDVQRRLDLTAQIQIFEHKFIKLEEALHIKL